MADIHSHQFSELGFGGKLILHSAYGGSCKSVPDFHPAYMRVQDLVRRGLFDQAERMAERNGCWPTNTNLTGQQMDFGSLKRAWEYGLRLLVVFAVNSEFLCQVAELGDASSCADEKALDTQLQAAWAAQDRIDRESGGPGRGWYRIVTDPAAARSVISEGKLAVVLGIEAAGAYDCGAQRGPVTTGVVPIIGQGFPNLEYTYRVGCSDEFNQSGLTTQLALARFEHYWNEGARHFFPVHTSNSSVGGTALSTPLIHATQNPAELKPGDALGREQAINDTITKVRPQFETFRCGSTFDFDGGACNRLGLTDTGHALVRHMASYGAMIDVDHLSLKAKTDMFAELGPYYGFVSSHSGMNEINNDAKSSEGQLTGRNVTDLAANQGAFGIILRPAERPEDEDTYPAGAVTARYGCGGSTEAFIQSYRYLVDKIGATPLQTDYTYVQENPRFVGVAFGSDFNGLAGWPGPRFVRLPVHFETPKAGAGCTILDPGVALPANTVRYPFASPLTGGSFDRTTLKWSGKTIPYDVSEDGVAHAGMLPDMVEEMRVLGLSDVELEPLWRGAEQYVRTWEHVQGWTSPPTYGTEVTRGVRDTCRDLRAKLLEDAAAVPATMEALKQNSCTAT